MISAESVGFIAPYHGDIDFMNFLNSIIPPFIFSYSGALDHYAYIIEETQPQVPEAFVLEIT